MSEKVHQYAYKDANDLVTLLHKAQSNGQRVRLGEAANVLEVIDKPEGFPARIVSWLRDLSGAHLKDEEKVADRLQHLVDQALPMSLQSSTLLEKNPQRVNALLYSHEAAPAILAKEMGIDEARAQEIVDQRMHKLYGSGLGISKDFILPVTDAHCELTLKIDEAGKQQVLSDLQFAATQEVNAAGISTAFLLDLPRATFALHRKDTADVQTIANVTPGEYQAAIEKLCKEKSEYPNLLTNLTQVLHQGVAIAFNKAFQQQLSETYSAPDNKDGFVMPSSSGTTYSLVVEANGDFRVDVTERADLYALSNGSGYPISFVSTPDTPGDPSGSTRTINASIKLSADDLRQGKLNHIIDGEARCDYRIKVDWENTV